MGIAVLNELQDRLYTSAIAGANLLNEDFRLKRALEQFETLSASAPVLKKVYEQVKPVTNPECKEKETALIDAITLVDAVVCTQGSFEEKEEITPIPVKKGTLGAQHRYNELEPVIRALSETGSGRYEVIESKWREQSDIFSDFRLKSFLVKALGDPYGEMANLVQNILVEMGEEMISFLKEGFDPKGGKEMQRRLEAIEKISREKENDFYLSLLENASAAIRDEAIYALSYDEKNTDKLIELTVTEKGNAKKMACYSLGLMENEKAVSYWEKELSKKISKAEKYLVLNKSERISDLLAEKFEKLIHSLLELDVKEPVNEETCKQLEYLVNALYCKSSPKLIELFGRLDENGKALDTLKNKDKKPLIFGGFLGQSYQMEISAAINSLLISSMVYLKSEKLIAEVKKLFYDHSSYYAMAGLAAFMLSEPEKAYDVMEPYFSDSKTVRGIANCFTRISYNASEQAYQLTYYIGDVPKVEGWKHVMIFKDLDIRWLKKFISKKNNLFHQYINPATDRVIENLINYNNTEQLDLMKGFYYERAKQGDNCLFTLHRCGWTDFKGLIPVFLSKQKSLSYNLMVHLYRILPIPEEVIIEELYQIADMIEKGSIHSQWKSEQDRVRKAAERFQKTKQLYSLY